MSGDREFNIKAGLSLAASVATIPCQTERADAYEKRIPDYRGRDFTYLPMPYDEQYYNTEEGWLRDIKPDQYVKEDTHIMELFERLQDRPFLLLDYNLRVGIELYDGHILLPEQTVEEHSIEQTRVVTYEDALDIDASSQIEEPPVDTGLHVMFAYSEENELIQETNIGEIRDGSEQELLDAMNEISYNFDDRDRFGIITISDLNRRPVKEMIYRALSELEIRISKNIESEYQDSRQLFKPARPATIGRWEKDQMDNLGLHIAEYMTLIELQQVLKMSDSELVERCGFESKNAVDDLSSINSLRNKVMHSNRTLVHNRRDVSELLDDLNRIEDIINNASKPKHW